MTTRPTPPVAVMPTRAARGVKPDVADFYDQALRKGSILVAVEHEDPGMLDRAEAIFHEAGVETVPVP